MLLGFLILSISVSCCTVNPTLVASCIAYNSSNIFYPECPCITCNGTRQLTGNWKCVVPITCNITLAYCSFCYIDSATCGGCINNYYALMGDQTCTLCSNAIRFCTSCSSKDQCNSCISNEYALNAVSSQVYCIQCAKLMVGCLYCSASTVCTKCVLGVNVTNGCTRVTGCVSVNPNLDVSANCLSCNITLFYPYPFRNNCVCKQGWLIGQLCGNIVGCSNLQFINSIKTCVSCITSQHLVLENQKCICRTYFQFNGSKCSQICGDGHLFDLPCDDGNLIDGDGCSSTCNEEANYICKWTQSFPASQCMYNGKIRLVVSNINQINHSNKVQIILNIAPYISSFTKMNISGLFNFTSPFCQVISMSITNKQLVITVAYNATVTNQSAKLSVQYGQKYVISSNFTMDFKMTQSNGGQLIYYPYIGDIKQCTFNIFYVLSVASLAVFVLGSLTYKMIGVQTIHTYQILLLLVVKSEAFPYLFTYLSDFSILYGKFSLIYDQSSQLFINHKYFRRLGYTQQPLHDYRNLAIIQILLILIYILLKALQQYFKNKLDANQEKMNDLREKMRSGDYELLKKDNKLQIVTISNSLQKVQKIKLFFYNWLLFPIFIGFFFHFVNTLFVLTISSEINCGFYSKLTPFLILAMTVVKYSVFFNEIKSLFISKYMADDKLLKSDSEQNYISFYLIFYLLLFGLILTGLSSVNTFSNEFSIVIIGVHLTYICIKRPYQQIIHNLAILINQSTIFLTIAWLLFEKYFSVSHYVQKKLLYCLFGMIVTVILLSLARTIYTFRQKYLQRSEQTKKIKKKKKKEKIQQGKQMNILHTKQNKLMTKNTQNIMFKRDTNPLSSLIGQQNKKYKQNEVKNKQLLKFYQAEVRKRLIQQ